MLLEKQSVKRLMEINKQKHCLSEIPHIQCYTENGTPEYLRVKCLFCKKINTGDENS